MNNQETRPSGWYYGLAALALVLGCLIAMVVVSRWFPGLVVLLGSGLGAIVIAIVIAVKQRQSKRAAVGG